MKDQNTIAQIIQGEWENILARCNSYQIRILYAIMNCRTAYLGGELYQCDKCSKVHIRYNSCGNRHCPNCQNTEKIRWAEAQQSRLINTTYYHVVFTLPEQLNELCLKNQRPMYRALFHSAWDTLNGFGWNKKFLGAQLGATMVLHTWGSNMSYHPHVHCIVPGGGVTMHNKWKEANGKGKYLFPVDQLSIVYRQKYLAEIKKAGIVITPEFENKLCKNAWVVYAKPAFGNRETLINYLARYSYKTAITNYRILHFDNKSVTFTYIDYRHRNQKKKMSVSRWEFVRRFAMHILPKYFMRIRHYGILHTSWKSKMFPYATNIKKDYKTIWEEKGLKVDKCPFCKKGSLQYLEKIQPKRGPPMHNHEKQNTK